MPWKSAHGRIFKSSEHMRPFDVIPSDFFKRDRSLILGMHSATQKVIDQCVLQSQSRQTMIFQMQ